MSDDNYQGPGRYRHYKGGEYHVLGLALKEDTVVKQDPEEISRLNELELAIGMLEGNGLHFAVKILKQHIGELCLAVYMPISVGSMLEQREEDYWAREISDFNEWIQYRPHGATAVSYPRFEKIPDNG